jgi:hypothetical protein
MEVGGLDLTLRAPLDFHALGGAAYCERLRFVADGVYGSLIVDHLTASFRQQANSEELSGGS